MAYVDDDEPPLRGEFLRLVCRALERNSISSLKMAAIIPDPEEKTLLPFPPARETLLFSPNAKRKEG
jgi:hypothetical protein